MLRILIVATLLFLISAASAWADAPDRGGRFGTCIGRRHRGPAARSAPASARRPSCSPRRPGPACRPLPCSGPSTASCGRNARRTAATRCCRCSSFGGDRPGLGLPVSESVSLGLRYQYLRPEDIRRDVAETGSLDDEYSSHNLVLRARWKF